MGLHASHPAQTLDAPPARARIGAVRYLNTIPLIDGLARLRDIELRLAAPAALIGMVERDEVDLALASIVDTQHAHLPIAVIPVGMIGSEGETRTVRLLSTVPIDRIETLHADTESHTSVVLARLIVGWAHDGRAPEVVPWDASSRDPWPEAVVVIGDKTTDPRASAYPVSIDLGRAWRDHTSLPFVYAAWMCRADRADSEAVAIGAAVLDRQRRHNAMRLDTIVAAHAPRHGWSIPDAHHYISSLLRYEVTDDHRAAVDRFLSEAGAMGLIDSPRPVRWVEPHAI